jgi:ADP-ribose pyrophosphatase YjhB (NUDIX family)
MGEGKNGNDNVIEAAGGLVWCDFPDGRKLVVIHRPRHGDWTLPKGKLGAGESWQDAALREVHEETGLEVRLEGFAGSCSYISRKAPKVVLYWHMRVVGDSTLKPIDSTEVDKLRWLSIEKAHAKLTYEREKRLLQEGVETRSPAWSRVLAKLRWRRPPS